MYVTLVPCNECTKSIIQAGIKEIVYLSDTHQYRPSTIVAKRMLDHVGIVYRQVQVEHPSITLSLTPIPPHPSEIPNK